MRLAVGDELHHGPVGAEQAQQMLGDLSVGELHAAADVVDLAGPPSVGHQGDAADRGDCQRARKAS